ncbi:MAG: T9SS type A sorting domain-containing protein [Bacteroidia bacterium]
MRYVSFVLAISLLGRAWAQCPQCSRVSNNNPDVNYNPPELLLPAGATNYRDTVQFALLDSIIIQGVGTLYPNFGIFVDSLRVFGNTLGAQYQTPGNLYNKSNPTNGIMRFDRLHADNFGGTNFSIIPHANLKKYTPNIPPHGCVTVCLPSVPNTPGVEDSIRIKLRAYFKINIVGFSPVQDTQDTTTFNGTLLGNPTYQDTFSVYKIRIVGSTALGKPYDIWSRGFELYPNPTRGEVNLRFEIRRPTHVSWELLDMLGKEVYHAHAYYQVGIYHESLRLPSLSPGMYLLRARTENEIHTEKLLIE